MGGGIRLAPTDGCSSLQVGGAARQWDRRCVGADDRGGGVGVRGVKKGGHSTAGSRERPSEGRGGVTTMVTATAATRPQLSPPRLQHKKYNVQRRSSSPDSVSANGERHGSQAHGHEKRACMCTPPPKPPWTTATQPLLPPCLRAWQQGGDGSPPCSGRHNQKKEQKTGRQSPSRGSDER